jgi:hypothetical protein
MEGWIRLHRAIKEHWLWNDPVKFQWWVDILLTVNHSDTKVNIGYMLIDCKRGQSIKSLSNWAKQWSCSKDTVRNFFKLLEKDSMILLESLQKTTRLTVCNYDNYQTNLHAEQTQGKRCPNDTSTQTIMNKNEKNVKNDNNPIIPLNLFNNEFKPLIDRFISYRKEIKKPLKSSQSIELLIENLEKYSGGDLQKATEIIDYSISNGYQGIFEPKENPAATGFNNKNNIQKNKNHGIDPFGSSFN